MKLSAFYKGLIMALVGFVATTISEIETFNFGYVFFSTLGFTIVYVVKNAVFPSKSVWGKLSKNDFISGLILAVGMGLSSFAAQLMTIGFEWHTLWVAVSGAVVGYIIKTVPHKA